MESPVNSSWLADPEQAARFEQALPAALALLDAQPGPAVICREDRIDYLAGVLAAIVRARPCFLANPQWGENEWEQAAQFLPVERAEIVEPHTPCGGSGNATLPIDGCQLLIPTGGTGGRIKFAIHTPGTLLESVRGYQQYWGGKELRVVCPMPLCHIGGLMLALRALWTDGQLWLVDPKLEQTPPEGFDLAQAHVSLVGAQLRRALDNDLAWLKRCEAVLVGGGPTDAKLAQEALAAGIPLYVAYGLTEAAATVALARVDDGAYPPTGEILPHWRVTLTDEEICLSGPALFEGYLGEAPRAEPWPTSDRGRLENGRLIVLGRKGRIIITGGKKVDADLLESRLRAWPELRDVAVWGQADAKWGSAVTALAVTELSPEALVCLAQERLMPEMRPKEWFTTASIPRGENGKLAWAPILSLTKKT